MKASASIILCVVCACLSVSSARDLAPEGFPAAFSNTNEYQILDQWWETLGVGTNTRRVANVKIRQIHTGENSTRRTDEKGNVLVAPQESELGQQTTEHKDKIHPRLEGSFHEAAAQGKENEPLLTVIVWFACSEAARKDIDEALIFSQEGAEGAPESPRPEEQKDVAQSLLLVREAEQANVRRRSAIAERVLAVTDDNVEHLGIPEDRIQHRFRFAPAVAARLTLKECEAMEASDLVNYIFPDDEAEKELDIIGPASKGPMAWHDGYDGAGVTIAHIEPEPGKMETANPYLAATVYLPAGSVDGHATAIGGIIRSTHSTHKGMAHGCTLLGANAASSTESSLGAATDWAVDQGASVVNMSYGLNNSADGSLHWSDIYYDYMVHYSRVLFTKSAGNEGTGTGVVTSPGRGYNSLAVGNVDGGETTDWGDDTMRSSSSFGDPVTSTEKPEIAAYGTDVDTTMISSPWIGRKGSGTSYAAPLVAAIAGLCIDKSPGLSDEPAALKALLMVSGLSHNIEGAGRLSDVDGAGCALATAVKAGFHARTLSESDFDASGYFEIPVDINLSAGDPKRIVFAYTHPPSSQTASPDPSSYYKSDLDFYLYVDGSQVASSTYGSQNPFEIIDYTPSSSGTGRVKIKKFSWDSNVSSLRIGVAYASRSTLGTGPDPGGSTDDAYEENDTLATAYDFTSEQTWLSSIDSLGAQSDDDWYEINVSPSGYELVQVDCRFTDADGDIDVQLVDWSGTVLASSVSTSDNEFIEHVVPSAGTYYIRVYYDDAGNTYDLWWDDLPANHAPSDMALSSSTVAENQPPGTTVGTLSTTDPDVGDTFTYTLVSGTGDADNGSFTITGDQLKTAAMFDYETKNSYAVRLLTTDQGGLSYDEATLITVLDIDERPTAQAPQMLDGSNIVIRRSSMTNNEYSVCSTSNLLHGFSVIRSNIVATPPENTYTDSMHNCKQKFWQITVE